MFIKKLAAVAALAVSLLGFSVVTVAEDRETAPEWYSVVQDEPTDIPIYRHAIGPMNHGEFYLHMAEEKGRYYYDGDGAFQIVHKGHFFVQRADGGLFAFSNADTQALFAKDGEVIERSGVRRLIAHYKVVTQDGRAFVKDVIALHTTEISEAELQAQYAHATGPYYRKKEAE
jgi:hypothetical protein